MIELLKKVHKNNIISKDDFVDLQEYIQKLFNPEISYSKWPMIEQYIPLTIDLLGNILEYIDEKIENNEIVSINFSLSDIAEGVRYCPDRQMAELKRAYSMIAGNTDSELESFIKNIIATVKERIFDLAITPSISKQNVHVLNYWKYEMRDTLGFDFNFKSKIGTMDQDPFDGHRGNALSVFFNKFTPNYVIGILTDNINEKKEVKYELMSEISKDYNLNVEDKLYMGVDVENFKEMKVTEEAIEYILIKKNLIIKLI